MTSCLDTEHEKEFSMPSQRKSSKAAAHPAGPFNYERELIVITTPQAELRGTPDAVASRVGADVDPLNAVLSESGATLVPVFGNEDRVARALSESVGLTAMANVTNLPSFYRVVAA